MNRYKPYFEDITIPLSKGDSFLWGKWKNKTAIYDSDYINEKGDLILVTDTGKEIPACKIRLIQENILKEDLRLSDLTKHAGVSDLTRTFMKDRQKIKGAGNISAKLKGTKINRTKDYITFIFTSKPTYSSKAQAVNPATLQISKTVRQYEQHIRILDFFKLAETKPGYIEKEMTWKEIKEILQVASIQVFCNDPSFQFQGDNAILTTFNAAIYPEPRMPQRWNIYHNDDNFLCKHLSLIFRSIDFWINPMTSMINKYINI